MQTDHEMQKMTTNKCNECNLLNSSHRMYSYVQYSFDLVALTKRIVLFLLHEKKIDLLFAKKVNTHTEKQNLQASAQQVIIHSCTQTNKIHSYSTPRKLNSTKQSYTSNEFP